MRSLRSSPIARSSRRSSRSRSALPGEADIAREIGRDVDPDAIFTARIGAAREIGTHLAAALAERYERLTGTAPYRPDAASAGRRALRNVCLDLLVAAARSPARSSAPTQQYQSADNMTDRHGRALDAVAARHAAAHAALEDFYARYANDPLIVDKWFSLQAAIPEPATLDRVKALTAHPAFSFANPNRVRALISAFAMANQTQFNRADGAGYDFIVETVLALDPKNPQVAARLLSALKSWRVLEATRRALAEAALRRVKAQPSLSRDVQDIVADGRLPTPA